MPPEAPMPSRRHLLALPLSLPLAGLASPALAQAPWPSFPVRIIVPFAAGGGTDVTLRMLVPRMAAFLGQPVVVENRPGAGSTLGTDLVAKAPPDGSVFVHATLSSTGIAAALYKRLPYDPIKDLVAIAPTVFVPLVLAVTTTGWDIRTPAQLVETLRANPNRYQYGSNGIGATGHLATANFLTKVGAQAVHIPYRGGGETFGALVKGEVQFLHDITGLLLPHAQAGTVRPLFVTSPERSPVMPEVPTAKEAGIPDYPAYSWFGLFGPAGTPAPIQARLGAAVDYAMADQTIRDRMESLGTPAMLGWTPERFTAYVKDETALWGPLVRASGAEQN